MRRRKNKKVYIRPSPRKTQPESSYDSTTLHIPPTPELRDFHLGVHRAAVERVNQAIPLGSSLPMQSKERVEVKGGEYNQLRKILQKVTGLNAVLSVLVSSIGYLDIRKADEVEEVSDYERTSIRAGLWLLSLIQVALIVIYARIERKHAALMPYSPSSVVLSSLECAFHLLLPVPKLLLQGNVRQQATYSLLSLDDFLYVLLLMRNYHWLRYLFWASRFSERRTMVFAEWMGVEMNRGFVLKCYFRSFSLKLALVLFGSVTVIGGLVLFSMEKGAHRGHLDSVSDTIWVATIAKLTIGYGDLNPTTIIGQLVTILICFLGISLNSLVLSLSLRHMGLSQAQSRMYSSLTMACYKHKKQQEAVTLLQAWWRFMVMRHRGKRKAVTIIHFYTLLRLYRRVLATAERKRDRRFETQISAFEASVRLGLRRVTEYMEPIRTPGLLLIDIMRAQYQIKALTTQVWRTARRLRIPDTDILTSSSCTISPRSAASPDLFRKKRKPRTVLPDKNVKGFAKAKAKAHQKLIGRLIRGQDLGEVVPISEFPISGLLPMNLSPDFEEE